MSRFRFPALLLAGALILLPACSGGGDPAPAETPPAAAAPAPTPTPDPGGDTLPGPSPAPEETVPPEETPSPEPEPLPTPTPAPDEIQTPPAAPAPDPTPAPVPDPEPTPELTGDPTVLQAVWQEIDALELPSLMELDGETLAAVYGIDSADLDQYICRIPMMNVHATEFFLARVSSGRMDAVKAAVESRQKDLEEQWSSYLPAQLELVQNYQLAVNGDYIFFAVSEHAAEAAEIFQRYTK